MPLVRAPYFCGNFSDLFVMRVGRCTQAQLMLSRHTKSCSQFCSISLLAAYEDTIVEYVVSYFLNYLADFQ